MYVCHHQKQWMPNSHVYICLFISFLMCFYISNIILVNHIHTELFLKTQNKTNRVFYDLIRFYFDIFVRPQEYINMKVQFGMCVYLYIYIKSGLHEGEQTRREEDLKRSWREGPGLQASGEQDNARPCYQDGDDTCEEDPPMIWWCHSLEDPELWRPDPTSGKPPSGNPPAEMKEIIEVKEYGVWFLNQRYLY